MSSFSLTPPSPHSSRETSKTPRTTLGGLNVDFSTDTAYFGSERPEFGWITHKGEKLVDSHAVVHADIVDSNRHKLKAPIAKEISKYPHLTVGWEHGIRSDWARYVNDKNGLYIHVQDTPEALTNAHRFLSKFPEDKQVATDIQPITKENLNIDKTVSKLHKNPKEASDYMLNKSLGREVRQSPLLQYREAIDDMIEKKLKNPKAEPEAVVWKVPRESIRATELAGKRTIGWIDHTGTHHTSDEALMSHPEMSDHLENKGLIPEKAIGKDSFDRALNAGWIRTIDSKLGRYLEFQPRHPHAVDNAKKFMTDAPGRVFVDTPEFSNEYLHAENAIKAVDDLAAGRNPRLSQVRKYRELESVEEKKQEKERKIPRESISAYVGKEGEGYGFKDREVGWISPQGETHSRKGPDAQHPNLAIELGRAGHFDLAPHSNYFDSAIHNGWVRYMDTPTGTYVHFHNDHPQAAANAKKYILDKGKPASVDIDNAKFGTYKFIHSQEYPNADKAVKAIDTVMAGGDPTKSITAKYRESIEQFIERMILEKLDPDELVRGLGIPTPSVSLKPLKQKTYVGLFQGPPLTPKVSVDTAKVYKYYASNPEMQHDRVTAHEYGHAAAAYYGTMVGHKAEEFVVDHFAHNIVNGMPHKEAIDILKKHLGVHPNPEWNHKEGVMYTDTNIGTHFHMDMDNKEHRATAREIIQNHPGTRFRISHYPRKGRRATTAMGGKQAVLNYLTLADIKSRQMEDIEFMIDSVLDEQQPNFQRNYTGDDFEALKKTGKHARKDSTGKPLVYYTGWAHLCPDCAYAREHDDYSKPEKAKGAYSLTAGSVKCNDCGDRIHVQERKPEKHEFNKWLKQ